MPRAGLAAFGAYVPFIVFMNMRTLRARMQ
jgi:hypothetical protein